MALQTHLVHVEVVAQPHIVSVGRLVAGELGLAGWCPEAPTGGRQALCMASTQWFRYTYWAIFLPRSRPGVIYT